MDGPAPKWFLRQLAETCVWCQERTDITDPEHCLRSLELRPDLTAYRSEDRAIWVYSEMIREVVRRRRTALSSGPIVKGVDAFEGLGRLLVSAYDYSNTNGATAGYTGYFLDENDVPPWDSWVGEVQGLGNAPAPGTWGGTWPPTAESWLNGTPPNQGLLVSWVPAEFIGVVERGLEVECIGMMCWADTPVRVGAAGPDFNAVVPTWLKHLALQYRPN